jgi:ribosomal silencing factor RsfS
MRYKGGLKITEDDPIDIIIKEYKNRAIDTNDIYGIIEDMGDDGIEVIGVIVDYMKRIRPAEKANDEKGELKNITNELKELAKFYDVPVITAQQLNRAGAAVVDAAIQANKEDVTRLVGRENVAGAWEIIENSDVVIIVNPDVKRDTGELYMSFNMIKRRYRSTDSDDKMRRLVYFNQPFEPGSEIKLVDDFYLQSPVSVESLGTQFLPENANRNAMQRENKKKKKEEGMLSVEDFEPFDMENYNN